MKIILHNGNSKYLGKTISFRQFKHTLKADLSNGNGHGERASPDAVDLIFLS